MKIASETGINPMKRTIALAFLAATLISIGGTRAHAQALEAKVPFDFAVADRVLPAGTYQISYTTQNGILIRNQDGRFHAMSTTFAAYNQSKSGGKLVFKKYGNQYFLHEVLCSDVDMNVAIPTSRLEKRAQIQEAQLAGTETVAALHTSERK
jgi:hypothetical protein